MARWDYKINIKQYIKDETSAQAASAGILKEIKKLTDTGAFTDDMELDQIREEFDGIVDDTAATNDEFDAVLERFYDWADRERVWCGL